MRDKIMLRFMALVCRALKILLIAATSDRDEGVKKVTNFLISDLNLFIFEELKKG